MFLALWAYRGFVLSSIRNEFIARFSRSRLGGFWMIIHPLAQVAIFALVLSNVLAAKLPGIASQHAYPLYLMAGTLAWNLFSEIVGRCLNLFIEHGNLLKKIKFPRIALPAIAVGICLTNNIFLFLSVLGVFAALGQPPGLEALWILLLMIPLVFLATGLGLILGTLNVFFRDIGQVVPVILQVLFWFTPIVYPMATIPGRYQAWMTWSPVYSLVHAYQEVLVYKATPDLQAMAWTLGLGGILLLVGLILFRRAGAELVDVL